MNAVTMLQSCLHVDTTFCDSTIAIQLRLEFDCKLCS